MNGKQMVKINFNIEEWNLLKNKWKKIRHGIDCNIEYPSRRSRIDIDKLKEVEDKISPDKLALIKTLIGRELPEERFEKFQGIIEGLNLDYKEIIKLEIFQKYDYIPVSFEETNEILRSIVKKEEKEHRDIIKCLVIGKQISSKVGETLDIVYSELLDYHWEQVRNIWYFFLDIELEIELTAEYWEKAVKVLMAELIQVEELINKKDEVELILKDKRKLIAGCIDIIKRYNKGAGEDLLTRVYDIYFNKYYIEKMPEGCNDPDKAYWVGYSVYLDDNHPDFTEKPGRAIIRTVDILVELMK